LDWVPIKIILVLYINKR